ncbi:MAG: DUF2344 domain-containing protein [Clostridia bacterium]|nr:DUF2344 domain-containing protein [Clostridia bacterium]
MDIRIKYGKTEQGKFISHLDLSRAWQRAFRRAQIPVLYSQGFNPHPKISFGSALAVGVTSSGEYMDVTLKKFIPIEEIKGELEKYLPKGLEVYTIVEITHQTPSLMAIINRARYRVTLESYQKLQQEELNGFISDLLRQEQVVVQRSTKNGPKEKDIRPGIFELKGQILSDKKIVVEMVVETGSGGNVRPEEVVSALMDRGLPLDSETMKIHREGLYVDSDTGLISPLSVIT